MAKGKKIQKEMAKAEASMNDREYSRLEASMNESRGNRGLPLISQLESPKGKGKKGNKGPGIIESIGLIILKKGNWINREGILKALQAQFPERNPEKMAKTIQAQLGGKAPNRFEKERGIRIEIRGKGRNQEYFRPDSMKA